MADEDAEVLGYLWQRVRQLPRWPDNRYWALGLALGWLCYLLGIVITLDSAPCIDLRLAWQEPAVWPLNLLAQEWFGVLLLIAGVLLLAEAICVSRWSFLNILGWHLAGAVTLNITLYASVAVIEASINQGLRPFTTVTVFAVLTGVIVLRITSWLWPRAGDRR